MDDMDGQAKCRGCGRTLDGSPYHKGGHAYVPATEARARVRALAHFYGGWVCSGHCNELVFRDMQSQNVASSEDRYRIAAGYDYFRNQ